MVSKKVVKKKYENKLRNQSLAIDGIKKENFESLVLKKLYRKVSNCRGRAGELIHFLHILNFCEKYFRFVTEIFTKVAVNTCL